MMIMVTMVTMMTTLTMMAVNFLPINKIEEYGMAIYTIARNDFHFKLKHLLKELSV